MSEKSMVDRLQYVLGTVMADCSHFGLVAIVPSSEVKGQRQARDSDEDYFDHYYVDQSCHEDSCSGHEYIPVGDGSDLYFKVEYHV